MEVAWLCTGAISLDLGLTSSIVATQFQFFPVYYYCRSLSPNSLRLNASLLPKNSIQIVFMYEYELFSVRRVSQRERPLMTFGFRQRFYKRWLDRRIYRTETKFYAVLGSLDCREKKLPIAISKPLFGVVFNFLGSKKIFKNFLKKF